MLIVIGVTNLFMGILVLAVAALYPSFSPWLLLAVASLLLCAGIETIGWILLKPGAARIALISIQALTSVCVLGLFFLYSVFSWGWILMLAIALLLGLALVTFVVVLVFRKVQMPDER
jgi:hypothetical protein